MKSYIITHRNEESSDEIIFTNQTPEELVRKLKMENGKDIWICGEANIANQLINKNLIDQYHITIIPTILGTSTPPFNKYDNKIDLKLIYTECYNGITEIVYERR